MKSKIFLGICFASILLNACNNKQVEQSDDMDKLSNDPHSYANMNEVRTTHMSLDLAVNFDTKTLKGSVEHTLENSGGAEELILDSRDLNIEKVVLDNGQEAEFNLGEEDGTFGQPLSIKISPETKKVKIFYETSPGAEALQWLSPEQTLGKTHPFLFSQSQAILARTWIPCQDGPGVKFTYDAKIQAPVELMALMSAENGTEKTSDGVYTFTMDQPISSYLMALAVGDLKFQSTGRNSGVYAEPAILEDAVWEFESMQSMIDSAEALYGEYAWGRYDVLVLPPSFPFGGMENPRLTFATPTIISGDRSLVALIAHELAHSWSGNLVTNETWNDFWLNEGFTVYFEQRIMEKIYGKDYEEMQTKLGMGELKKTIARLKEEGKPEDTHLYLELEGRNPDDGLTDVAYEKGRFFLQTVESVVGRAEFDKFLKDYFTNNKFQQMNTEKFIALLKEKLLTTPELQEAVRIEDWIYGPGIPDNVPPTESSELERVGNAVAAYNAGEVKAADIDTAGYTTHHWLYFLRGLENLDSVKMADLDETFKFTGIGNAEIACDWYQHCIEQDYTYAFPAMSDFLIRVGRRKFLTPLYTRLAKTEEHKAWAKEVYAKARPGYHAVSYNTIDEILK
ncbi:M1 family metallopeptidase [bacterium]|nr:M1 family metallopeptidase [bacterium]